MSHFHLFNSVAGSGNTPTLGKSNYTDSPNLSGFLSVRFLKIIWVSALPFQFRAAPAYLSKRYIKILAIWLELSIPKVNLLDKLQYLPAKMTFSQHRRTHNKVCFIFSLASNLATYQRTIFPSDSKNKSLHEKWWGNKASILEGADFLLDMQELKPRILLDIWLSSQSQHCAEK